VPLTGRLAALLTLSAIVGPAGALGGCSRTYNVPRPRSAVELQLTLMKQDGGVVTPIVVAPGPATGSAPRSGVPAAPVPWGSSLGPSGDIPMVDLSAIPGYEVKRRALGALEGFLIGALGGGLAGFVVGSSLGSDKCSNPDTCYLELSSTDKGIIGAVVAGVPGAVLGTLIGGVRGHTDKYLFQF